MAVHIKKRENESPSGMLYRFSKRIQQSGVLREAKRRRFYSRGESKLKLKASALHRVAKGKEFERLKKLGLN